MVSSELEEENERRRKKASSRETAEKRRDPAEEKQKKGKVFSLIQKKKRVSNFFRIFFYFYLSQYFCIYCTIYPSHFFPAAVFIYIYIGYIYIQRKFFPISNRKLLHWKSKLVGIFLQENQY